MLYSGRVLLIFFCLPGLISSQTDIKDEDICATRSCYPATGDLLVGRGDKLYASSTCGLRGPERYCIISNLVDRTACKICDSRVGSPAIYSHLPIDMVIRFRTTEPKTTWWQSQNGKENVYLQLNFEAQFHVTHILMKFKSFRPAAMLIERSYDYGKSWKVARYYARDCKSSFPGVSTTVPVSSSETYCTSEYSGIEPSTGGEVIYNALHARTPQKAAWTTDVQNLLRMTNVRINFTKLTTLGDDIIDNSLETNRKYFYAINWITIRGSCSCYGHAEECLPLPGSADLPGMVHSKCNCTHNTAGLNCERCKEGYQDRPWKPAFPDNPNECKKCDCHGHSDKCRFDRAVWEASGRKTGGVCLDCKHNTIGPKCDKCKPLHYQDPSKSIRDPDVCKPCDCDPVGSVGRGECQMEDKPLQNLRAGQCICKRNVEGPRCDRCKTGFYNLEQDNPDGCQSCNCNTFGTVGDSCDANSGQCTCKRFVVGRRCDKCKTGFWGLESSTGCKPCECDVGGALDNLCDAATGQCKCRRGIQGRKCDRVIPGYYFALSDNLKYEAEDARGIGVTSKNLLERPAGAKVVWTDVGSLKISSENGVEFSVTNVPMSGNYKLLMRFHPKTPSLWEEIKVTVSRADGQRTTNGECGNQLTSNGNTIITTTERNEATKVLEKVICLEKDIDYFVRIDFKRHQGSVDYVNLDSLVLIPSMESVSIFQGDSGRKRLNDFKNYNCESPNYPVERPRPTIHPVCRKLHFSGSAVIYNGALPCDCNQVGTVKNQSGIYYCDEVAGQCPCKPNVIGRRCDKCAPGSYKFGPKGCSPCACDLRGSLHNLCDVTTGQCICNGLGIGRQCNECPPKEWGFPRCRPCQCNGHAETCDPVTGVCIDCQHNTAGDHCELCMSGYFGNATKGTSTDCQQCQCPGGSSENQFSPTCRVDTTTSPPTFICDQCPPGYKGKQCEECDDGYFGNPLIQGGKCTKCNCSNNVDFGRGGGCDKRTGQCEGCLHNTAGFYCHECKRGYYGNARNQTCKPCDCSLLGTAQSSGFCDASTGQCPCKPNVVGRSCDRCAPGYWNLASGEGCKSCGCCAEGATTSQCDVSTGECICRRDFGGPKCCDCENGFWGKPPAQCKPCDCNPSGSLDIQCDRNTGVCRCRPGISGKKCNKCEPDTTRDFPECDECHPCYYSWKRIIDDLEKLAAKVGHRKTTSTVSVDYDKDLDSLDELRRRIKYILENRKTYPKHVEDIKKRIDKSDARISQLIDTTSRIDANLTSIDLRKKKAKQEIEKLLEFLRNFRESIDELRRNLTTIETLIPGTSLNASRHSLEKSTKTVDISKNVRKTLEESQNERKKIEEKLPGYEEKKRRISKKLDYYLLEYESLNGLVARVNLLLCGSPDDGCGGCNSTGCKRCGGKDCEGAVTMAENALAKAKEAELALREKERKANATLDEVVKAEAAVNESKTEAKKALELAKSIHLKFVNVTDNLSGVIEEIYKLLNRSGPDPNEVRRIAEFVLGRKLGISEEAIKRLAEQIKEAVKKLTGLDKIIEETTQDLESLEDLKQQAIKANSSATQITNVAKNVRKKLSEASVLQDTSRKSVKKSRRIIQEVEDILLEIESKLDDKLNKSIESVRITKSLRRKLGPLEKRFEENDKMLGVAEGIVKDAGEIATEAGKNSKALLTRYDEVNKRFNDKLEEQRRFRKRAEKARADAESVNLNLTKKLKSIEGFLKRRVELDNLIDKLIELEKRSKQEFCEVNTASEFLLECPKEGERRSTEKTDCSRLVD